MNAQPHRSFSRAVLPILLATAIGCGGGGGAGKSYPGAPVVLVTIDTLRSDHLPMYGYDQVETPNLAAFRKESILFERAYSHVPLTLPSHGSIFTGQLPAVHGLRDNAGYRLAPGIPTLAELLGKAGYSTGGAISCIVLSRETGISRGFDFWEDSVESRKVNEVISRVQRSGAETTKILSDWISAQPPEKPLFAFLHLYEPHSPYEPPEPYASRYKGREYDGEIAWSDELVGRFFDLLKSRGLWDRSLVIVLSDHGEGLGEHSEDEHGIFLYRYALQVPLLVKLPGSERAGATVATPVQLADVFTTVVRATGLRGVTAPPGTLSLLDVAAGPAGAERRIFAETLFPRIHFGWADTASLIDGSWQYIEAPKPELFDLARDPAERENLAPGLPPAFRSLRIEMEKRRNAFTAPGTINPEEKKKLASLGYLSSGTPSASGPLPDAKDEISVLTDLRRGSGYLHTGRYAEAVETLGKLVARNPRMLDVWDLYVQALRKQGRNEEALAALKKAIAAAPDETAQLLISAANICLALGRLDEAEKLAEVARSRGETVAEEVIVRIHLSRKQWDLAEREAKAIMAARPGRRLPYMILARIEVERGNLAKALELVESMRPLPAGPESQAILNLHFLRGDILARMGRPKEAKAEFLEEIRLFPDNLDAYTVLAALYASEGQLADVREVVRRLVKENPFPEAFALGMKTLNVVGDRSGVESVRRAAAARFPGDHRFSGKA